MCHPEYSEDSSNLEKGCQLLQLFQTFLSFYWTEKLGGAKAPPAPHPVQALKQRCDLNLAHEVHFWVSYACHFHIDKNSFTNIWGFILKKKKVKSNKCFTWPQVGQPLFHSL